MNRLSPLAPAALLMLTAATGCDSRTYDIQPEPVARAQVPPPKPDSGPTEAVLVIDYQVQCDAKPGVRALHGTTRIAGRVIRVELFEATGHTEVSLGQLAPETWVELSLAKNDRCKLVSLKQEVVSDPSTAAGSQTPLKNIALAHSPYINVRHDQYDNRDTDLPLMTVYNTAHTDNGHTVIQYTTFFTDEDSKDDERGTEGQMDRYGRRTDIEWSYLVELDGNRSVVRRAYQGGFSLGALGSGSDFGHSFQEFEGEFLPGSQHPILYNSANNNVFDDEPNGDQKRLGLVGHHPVPRQEILSPRAREWAMIEQPWTYKVCDDELAAEGKLKAPSTDYLLVLIEGELKSGAFVPRLQLSSEVWTTSESDVDRLGEDMWHRQAFSAVRLNASQIEDLAANHWSPRLELTSTTLVGSADVAIESMRFFRLKAAGVSYESQEITERLGRCTLEGIKSHCDL